MYGLKLYYEWTSFTGIHNKVEIRDYDLVDDSGAIEARAIGKCFEVEYPDKQLGYEPIRSCGARMYFKYRGAEGFLDDFFTPDMKKFKVVHYIERNVNFIGYLNTELYDEDYSINSEDGIDVELTANNGLSVVERINYIQDDGSYYYGIDNLKSVLTRVFAAMGLEYQNLYLTTLFDLVIDDQGTLSTNYLNDEYINNSNWIDEDFDTSSIKEVLEHILLANGVYLITREDDIYILPVERQAKASATNSFYHYTLPDLVKQSNKSVDLSALEISTIGYKSGAGQRKSKVTSINSQELEFDPYAIDDDVIDGEIEEEGLFFDKIGEGAFGSGDYAWTKEYYDTHANFVKKTWNATYPINFVKAYKDSDPTNKQNYIDIKSENVTQIGAGTWAAESKPIPVYIINGSKLKVNVELYLQTKDDWDNPDDESGSNLNFTPTDAGCEIYIRSGNYCYNKNTKKFDTYFDPAINSYPGTANRECLIQAYQPFDDWTPYHFFDQRLTTESIIEFDYDDGLSIDNNIVVGITTRRNGYLPVDFARIYNVKVSIYDELAERSGVHLSELVKACELTLDSRYKNKGEKINIRVGTMLKEPDYKVSNPNQRGALFYSSDGVNFKAITSFSKDGVSASSTEYWVLKQIVDNYSTPCDTLKARFKAFDMLRPVKDTPFLGSKLMLAIGGTYDYFNDTFETTLQEIKPMT